MIARKAPLLSEAPLELLAIASSVPDGTTTSRKELESTFAALRNAARELKLVTSSIPQGLDLKLIGLNQLEEATKKNIKAAPVRNKTPKVAAAKGFGASRKVNLETPEPSVEIEQGSLSMRPCRVTSLLSEKLVGDGANVGSVETLLTVTASGQIVGRGLFASKPIKSGDTILRIPDALCIRGGVAGLPRDLALAMHLLDTQENHAHGPHGLYLKTLPSADALSGCGAYWQPLEIAELRCPALEAELLWRANEIEFLLRELSEAAPMSAAAETAMGERLRWATACVRSRAVGSKDGPVLIPLYDMVNHAPRERANSALCTEYDESGNCWHSVLALQPIREGSEILVVYDAAAGSAAQVSPGTSSSSSIVAALRAGQGVVPSTKLVADYGFLADPALGQAFVPGELDMEVTRLTKGGASGSLEGASSLTNSLLADFEVLKASANNSNAGTTGGELSPRMRLALLHRLGRTLSILQAFGKDRRGAAKK